MTVFYLYIFFFSFQTAHVFPDIIRDNIDTVIVLFYLLNMHPYIY